ncbi:MAG: hypothetical protein QOE83_2640 [Actinomycetota bacterium]|nr:hypothetical protein [Actinomycetota bacterium]
MTTVLFIGGLGRSGSTLLDRTLGQVPGMVAVGELVFLWERGLINNELCGCGEPVGRCPFWRAVGDAALGGWNGSDIPAIEALRRRVDRNRFVPLMRAPLLSSSYARDLRRYTQILGRLYAGIARVSGAQVVVDSSKHVSTYELLRRVPGVSRRLVHLVRDPRAVAFSWGRRIQRPDVVDREVYMPVLSPGRSAQKWIAYNTAFDALRGGGPRILQRYEDLVGSPAEEVRRVLSLVGMGDAELPFLDGNRLQLGTEHTISGNPSKFRTGSIDITADEEWRRAMPVSARSVVTAITWPGLIRFGYLGAAR